MPRVSAGLLLFRRRDAALEVLLVHPGGPFWAKRDAGVWSIPKGLADPGEDLLAAARREFTEETGCPAPAGAFLLGDFRQPGGKAVTAYAAEGDFDLSAFRSNSFAMEWPPRSGRMAEFPEVDRAEWLTFAEAERRILEGQLPILAALSRALSSPDSAKLLKS